MKQLLWLFLLAGGVAQAEIYKSQNEDGQWIYSDRPSRDAKPIKLRPLSTYTPAVVPAGTAPDELEEEETVVYKSMRFLAPADDLTIRDNAGVVAANITLDPPLQVQRSHKIQFFLDGSPYRGPTVSAGLQLKGVDRGTHVLGARVVDADGKTLFEGTPVTFHMLKYSTKNPFNPANRKQVPGTP